MSSKPKPIDVVVVTSNAWCDVMRRQKIQTLVTQSSLGLYCSDTVSELSNQCENTNSTKFGETRCPAIAERPRCRVRYSFRQKWKTGTGRQYFTDRSIFNHCNIMGLKICRIRWKNAK